MMHRFLIFYHSIYYEHTLSDPPGIELLSRGITSGA